MPPKKSLTLNCTSCKYCIHALLLGTKAGNTHLSQAGEDEKIAKLKEVCNIDSDTARKLLESNFGDVDSAVQQCLSESADDWVVAGSKKKKEIKPAEPIVAIARPAPASFATQPQVASVQSIVTSIPVAEKSTNVVQPVQIPTHASASTNLTGLESGMKKIDLASVNATRSAIEETPTSPFKSSIPANASQAAKAAIASLNDLVSISDSKFLAAKQSVAKSFAVIRTALAQRENALLLELGRLHQMERDTLKGLEASALSSVDDSLSSKIQAEVKEWSAERFIDNTAEYVATLSRVGSLVSPPLKSIGVSHAPKPVVQPIKPPPKKDVVVAPPPKKEATPTAVAPAVELSTMIRPVGSFPSTAPVAKSSDAPAPVDAPKDRRPPRKQK